MERNYIIPLRREWLKAPIYERTKVAARAAKSFLKRHMKVENVKLGRHLNMALWTSGPRNPPHKIEVTAEIIKDKEGDYVYAELVGVKKELLKPVVEEKKGGLAGKVAELTGAEKKKEEKVLHKEEDVKAAEKVEREVPLEKESAKPIAEDHTHVNKGELEKDRFKHDKKQDGRRVK